MPRLRTNVYDRTNESEMIEIEERENLVSVQRSHLELLLRKIVLRNFTFPATRRGMENSLVRVAGEGKGE